MQILFLTLSFLKKPLKVLPYLFATLCLSVLFIYATRPDIWATILNTNFIKSITVIAIPELLTMVVLLGLLRGYHAVFKIKTVVLSFKGILIYQLKILPVFLVAYFFFYPLTFSSRYLIEHYSDASFELYLSSMSKSITMEAYFLYLPSILFLGYLVLNVSLSKDYFSQSVSYSIENPTIIEDITTDTEPSMVADSEDLKYNSILKVRGVTGDTFLKVEECIYFEAADHGSKAHHPEGIFKVSVSVLNLEKQLDPRVFFKISPKYIINLAYLDSYVYADKGQYALYLKKTIDRDLVVTRSRINALKSIFREYIISN